MELFLFPFQNGFLSVEKTAGEIMCVSFSPAEFSALSFYPCKVVQKSDSLGGFFLDCIGQRGFLPFSSAPGAKVGDRVLAQVSREAFENKPPRFTLRYRVPLRGCEVVFNSAGRVFLPPSGEGKENLKTLKELARPLKIDIYLLGPEKGCKEELSKAQKLLSLASERAKKGKPLRWNRLLTASLKGEIKILHHPGVTPLKETFEVLDRLGVKLVEHRERLKTLAFKGSISKVKQLVFGNQFTFEGGYLVYEIFEGFNLIDVNGGGFKETLSLKAAESLVELVKLLNLGGKTLADFPTLNPKTKNLIKHNVREKLWKVNPFGKVLGFTNGGILEIVLPKVFRPLKFSLGKPIGRCGGHLFTDDELFKLLVLEKLAPLRGAKVLLKVSPERIPAVQNLPVDLSVKVVPSYELGPDGFEIEPL
jgi:hypothetical protein